MIWLHSFSELTDFKARRIQHFRKNMIDLVELELKHARVSSCYSHFKILPHFCIDLSTVEFFNKWYSSKIQK